CGRTCGRCAGGRFLHVWRDRSHARRERLSQPDPRRAGAELTMTHVGWSTHQLAEYLASISAFSDEESLTHGAVDRAAEAFEAEVGALIAGGRVIYAVGFPAGGVPEADLLAA